jgi:hypothetical protein
VLTCQRRQDLDFSIAIRYPEKQHWVNRMTSNGPHTPRQHIRAAIAGALSLILLTGIGVAIVNPGLLAEYTYVVGGEACPTSYDPRYFWHACCAVAKNLAIGIPLLSIVGASIAIAGCVYPLTFRATAIGSVALVLLAWTAPLVQVSAPHEAAERQRVFEAIGWLAVVLAFLSISSCVSALAAETISPDGRNRLQFSLQGSLFLFVPFAVIMGWLQHFMRI